MAAFAKRASKRHSTTMAIDAAVDIFPHWLTKKPIVPIAHVTSVLT
jgi:hypothetical protein